MAATRSSLFETEETVFKRNCLVESFIDWESDCFDFVLTTTNAEVQRWCEHQVTVKTMLLRE